MTNFESSTSLTNIIFLYLYIAAKAPHGQSYFIVNIQNYFKWSTSIYIDYKKLQRATNTIWFNVTLSYINGYTITNNCLERAIFQMFSGGVRKPIFFQMVNVGLSFNIIARFWHKILLFSKCIHLNFKILDNSSLCGTNFHKILKYITIQHGCLPHLQAPRGSRDPPTGIYRNKEQHTWWGSWSPLGPRILTQ